MAKKFKKYFTPNEANKRLPYIKKVVSEILDKGRNLKIEQVKSESEEAVEHSMALHAEIEELMLELEDLGCFYKDWNFEIGLVDFPAKINGEEVFLCWRSDESSIRFFHPVEAGYSNRQEIPEIYLNSLN